MKKTIAILLILVIGMVGVFAAVTQSTSDAKAEGGATINLKAEISPIDRMGLFDYLTEGADTAPTSNDSAWNDVLDVTISTNTATPIAYLHTRSNNRSGITVTMTAGKLSSGTVVLPYSVSATETGTNPQTFTAAYPAISGGFQEEVTIISTSSFETLTTTSRVISVTIPTYDTAPTGTYTGEIVFNYKAN